MCNCFQDGCKPDDHAKHCFCSPDPCMDRYRSKDDVCCLTLGCKIAKFDSGHKQTCKEYKICLCLESGCGPTKHQFPCVCNQKCECTVYYCPIGSCCDRKPQQKCRYYAVTLCNHCDHLRKVAMYRNTYDKKQHRKLCECDCHCLYECEGFCKQCDTHSQQGWNLLNWQQLRTPQIFTDEPKDAPYHFEDSKTQEKIPNICVECHKKASVMKQFDRSCGWCFDLVCYSCRSDFKLSRTETDYDGNCVPYWRYFPSNCKLSPGEQHYTDSC